MAGSGCRSSSALAGCGGDDTERVNPKTNGIGSKNFGLRSLFLFGDQIYVRSGGHVAILDLPTLETGRVRDPAWWRGTGVRLKVPYRRRTFEKLEPFTAEEEKRVFETMAGGMLATLVSTPLQNEPRGPALLSCDPHRHWGTQARQRPRARGPAYLGGLPGADG